MEPRIIAPNPTVTFATTAQRVTPSPPSASKFGDVLANTAVQSAESAMTVLPGGPMMAVALRGGAASVPLTSTTTQPLTVSGAKSAEGPTASTTAVSPIGAAAGIGGTGVAGTGSITDPTAASTNLSTDPSSIQSSLQQSADMNMYMLQVQQQVQQQGQQFTTLSNVMKAQYDTVKNAIGNIR